MIEILILVSALSAMTLVVGVLYSRRISEAHERYAEAKNVLDDMILSFNRQLERQEGRLEATVQKVDVLSSQAELLAKKQEEQEKEVRTFTERVEPLSALEEGLPRIDVLEKKLSDVSSEIVSVKDTLLERVTELEKRRPRPREPEPRIEAAIPIRRDKALAPLTETELAVLELLALEGEKTAPEIKEHIKLSREHTARLMKRLYEKGYLERIANKIPFTYRLKEEMQRILKKSEKAS